MSEYTRHLRDVIFHAQNAQRSIEEAQAKAPADDKPTIDTLCRDFGFAQRWAGRAAREAERRGGIRA